VARVPESPGELPAAHAARLAGEVSRRLCEEQPGALVVFGGAAAFAILCALGRPPLYPVGEAAPGVPVSFAPLENGRGLWLVTKAGGFGPPDILDTIRAALEAPL
jgi:uncharacterized protein YgbK (DUF1537 family)